MNSARFPCFLFICGRPESAGRFMESGAAANPRLYRVPPRLELVGATAFGRFADIDLPGCFASPYAIEDALAIQNGRRDYLEAPDRLRLDAWLKRHIRKLVYQRQRGARLCGQNPKRQFRVRGRPCRDPFRNQHQMGTAAFRRRVFLYLLLIAQDPQQDGNEPEAGKRRQPSAALLPVNTERPTDLITPSTLRNLQPATLQPATIFTRLPGQSYD